MDRITPRRAIERVSLTLLAASLSACATIDTAPTPAAAAAATATKERPATPPGGDAAKAAAEKVSAAKSAAPAAGAAGASASGAPSAGGPPSPPPPRPFADIVKDAKEDKGFFTTWHKDDKVWIEIPENMWDRPFFFSVNVTNAIGDAGIFGNQMGGYLATGRGSYMASFRKFGTQGVQMIARNTSHAAADKSPAKAMIDRAFSDSLIGTAAIVSAPHPERKSVLIEANALLINDFPSAASRLELAYRQPYAFDRSNSSIDRAKNSDTETGFNVRAHYNLAKVVLPPPIPNPMAPPSRLPSTLPDVRSMFFGFYYGFSKLPEQPMRTRLSDPRVGYFSTTVTDYTNPDQRDPKARYINRWRLEKKDPVAAMSAPKEPIVFWLDKNVPSKYRDTVRAGILEWNKAYEKIGFKDAIVVKQQGDDADFDTSATRFASVRWVAGRGIQFGARGPSKVDPRTGEILDADIEMNEDITRLYTGRASEDPPRPVALDRMFFNSTDLCSYAGSKLNETALALDLLVARGDFEYGSIEAERFVLDAMKDITTHEVGHTLGLRHNFRASTSITPEQLRDAKFGAEVGISSSVMDYNALNIATKDEKQGQYSMVTVGPYDIWAVEYGYQEAAPEAEKTVLAKTLARATEPLLAYATDEDAGFGPIVEGIDPEVNRGDLGSDPLAFYEKRFAVVRELWDRWQTKQLPSGTQYEQLRRNFERGFNLIGQVSDLAAKYVGGVTVLRDVAGTGRQPITPVDAEKQRRALNLLTKNLFEVDSFKFRSDFLGKLTIDFDARFDSFDDDFGLGGIPAVDYSVSNRVLGIQRATLQQLMRDNVAARVIGAPERMSDASKALTVAELYETLQKAVWSELTSNATISPMRRNLQREHVRMVAQAVANPSPRTPADARSLQREFAIELLAKLKNASGKRGLTIENRAHINESIALIDAALKAQVTKALG
jgi:Met-zincin/Domain of unknown function (DUF5117)/Domain of unknown function (DUF5118)